MSKIPPSVLDDYSAGKQIISKAAGGAAKAAVASIPAASGLPAGPQAQEFARLTAEDLTNFGQGAAPYFLGGEALGGGIAALRLAPLTGKVIQGMVTAGYTAQQAYTGVNAIAKARDAGQRFGWQSTQFLDAVKEAGTNFGMAALGALSIAHGAATVYGEQKAKAMFQADPDAFAAAEAAMRKGVNPEQMKTPHGKAQAKATFDQAYSEAGGPEVKPDIIGGIKNAFSGKKPAPAQQPIAQLPPQEVPNAQPNAQQAQPTPVPVSAQAGPPEVAGVPPKGTVVQATPEGGKVAVAPAQPQAPRPAPGIPQVVAPQGPSTPVVAGQPPAPVEGSTGNVYNETRAEELPEKGNLQVRQPSADRSTGLRGVPPAVGSPIQGSAQEAQPAAASTSKDNTLPLREPPAQPNAEVLPGVQERGTTQNQPQVQGLSSGGKGQGGVPIVQPSIGQAGQNTPATMQGLRGAEGGNAPSSIPQFPSSGVGVPSVPPEAPPVPAAHQAILEAGGINPRPWEEAGMLLFEDPQTRSTLSIPSSTPPEQVAGLVRDKIAESRKAYEQAAPAVGGPNAESETPTEAPQYEPPMTGGARGLADAVYEKLKAGESLGNVTELNDLAEKHFGSARASGEWSPKDAFDAMEAGVNKYLIDRGPELMAKPFEEGITELRDLMPRLTSQGTRTEEQLKFQQFSTPPTEAYLAAKVSGVKAGDVVLEPSAGNGGLAVFPKAAGAIVHVNEVAPRRMDMLQHVGFEAPTAHDGEIIHSLLDQSVKPNVVIMNPPFSAGGLKGKAGQEVKNRNTYGFNHVASALQRLAPGGRLVAILGGGQANEPNGGAALTGGQSGKFFDRIAQEYNIRANVRIDGKEYAKYGTSFATRLIVIDKSGPTPVVPGKPMEVGPLVVKPLGGGPEQEVGPSQTFTPPPSWRNSVAQGNVKTLEEAYNVLKGVANDRPASTGTAPTGPGKTQPPTGVGTAPVPSGGSGGGPVSGSAGAGRPGELAGNPAGSPGTIGEPGSDGGSQGVPQQQPGVPAPASESPASPESPGGMPENAPDKRVLSDLEKEELRQPLTGEETPNGAMELKRDNPLSKAEEMDSEAFAVYQPSIQGPAHPGVVVESKTMATVPMPPITYKPNLPPSVMENGRLSAVQLEAIAIAGQQNALVLPSGARGSALVGDGTGVGKGRISAGILWDNWRQGRKRLVWVSEKWDLMQDAMRDLEEIGATDLMRGVSKQPDGKFVNPPGSAVQAFKKYSADAKIKHEGLLYSTYALIRSADKKGNRRVTQLEDWLRGEDDGDGAYILFDESHNLKNAVAGQGGQQSQIGKAVKELLERMPNLRTVSLSATAASDVMNLGYLDRLGLWGAGTAFPNGFAQFGNEIARGGLSAMELIARELKAQGKYVARTLSYKGVTYAETPHKLTTEQKDLYRVATRAWRVVLDNVGNTINNVTNGGGKQRANFMSQYWGAQLRFFNVLITTLKIPTIVEKAQQALADKKAVVITLVNTNEAAQNREKNRARAQGVTDSDEEVIEYDFGPAETLTTLIQEYYPVQQYEDSVDDNGRPVKVPVYKADGTPVLNPEAVRRRDALVADVKANLKLPSNPLDILIASLGGEKKVAELTGRKERFDEATGRFIPRGDPNAKRSEINQIEARKFQNGEKMVAILSPAAGTGISLHAGNNVKNQAIRYHVTAQVGWSADRWQQMAGRTHRTNQKQPPEYDTITSDLGGEKRFSSAIASRVAEMGAIVMGQSNAAAGGNDMMAKVNFITEQGRQATNAFYAQLLRDEDVPGTDVTGMAVLDAMSVLTTDKGQPTVADSDRTDISHLLNRMLALDPDIQYPVYNYFYDVFQATVADAIERGTLDTGVKTLPGDEFKVKERRVIAKDRKTGAETYYFPVDASVRTARVSPEQFDERIQRWSGPADRIRVVIDENTQNVALVREALPVIHADATATPAVYVSTPGSGKWKKEEAWRVEEPTVQAWMKERVEKAQRAADSAQENLDWLKRSGQRYSSTTYLENAQKELDTRVAALTEALQGSTDPVGYARDKWQQQYDAAPSYTTREHHLIGGAVMKFWNPIRDAAGFGNIYTTTDQQTGQRVVGVDVPAERIGPLLARIGGGGSTVDARQLYTDVLRNNMTYTLEGGIQVRPGRIGKVPVVRFFPPTPEISENLKRVGVRYEKGLQPMYFLPENTALDVLGKVLEQYPVKPEESESGGAGAEQMSQPDQPSAKQQGVAEATAGQPEEDGYVQAPKPAAEAPKFTPVEKAVLKAVGRKNSSEGLFYAWADLEGTFTRDELNTALARLLRNGVVERVLDRETGTDDFKRVRGKREAGFVASDLVLAPFRAVANLNRWYDRQADAFLQAAKIGRAFPEVESVSPDVAAAFRMHAAAPAYFKEKFRHLYETYWAGLGPQRERIAMMMADAEDGAWLQANQPGMYGIGLDDPEIQRALQELRPFQEELREGRLTMGGAVTDDVEHMRRTYPERVAGLAEAQIRAFQRIAENAKDSLAEAANDLSLSEADRQQLADEFQEANKNLKDAQRKLRGNSPYNNFDRVITKKGVNNKGRVLTSQEYWERGTLEIGPSFGPDYIGTMTKLAEHNIAAQFITEATMLAPGDEMPASIEYNGKQYFHPDWVEAIKSTGENGTREERDELAEALGIPELPRPEDVKPYGWHNPNRPAQGGMEGDILAIPEGEGLTPEQVAEMKNQAFGSIARKKSAARLYLGPRTLTEALRENSPEAVDQFLSTVKRFAREQVVGFGFGVPHLMNLMRRAVMTVPGGALNPQGWIAAFRPLLDKELKARGVEGVDDPTFDMLLRNAGLSADGIEQFKSYLKGMNDSQYWKNIIDRGDYGKLAGKAVSYAFRLIPEGSAQLAKIGHDFLYGRSGKPGIEIGFRLEYADRLILDKMRDTGLPAAQVRDQFGTEIAEKINQFYGKSNRAAWTEREKRFGEWTTFPTWFFSSVNVAVRHLLKATVPYFVLTRLANEALYQMGYIKRESDRNDVLWIHFGNHQFQPTILHESEAENIAGRAIGKLIQEKSQGKSWNQAAGAAAPVALEGIGRTVINPLQPIIQAPLELGFNAVRPGGSPIVERKDWNKPGALGNKFIGKVAEYGTRKALPGYGRMVDERQGGMDVPGFVGGNLGVPNFKRQPPKRNPNDPNNWRRFAAPGR